MKVYKVVGLSGSRPNFIFRSVVSGCCEVRYDVGEIVYAYPDTLGIFCYLTLPCAESMRCGSMERILEVEGIGVPRLPDLVAHPSCGSDYVEAVLWYLSGNIEDTGITRSYCPPKGTVCFDAVRVIGEVM